MRSGKWARPLFVVIPIMAVFAAGCGDFWQAPSTSTTCTTNCTTASSSDFYILNAGSTPGIVGLSIASGTLTDVGSSVSLGDAIPYSMAIAPNGDFLMVSTTTGVLAFPITNGVVGTAVAVTQDLAYSVAVDATDSWLIEAVPGTGGVGIFAVPIDSTTGANNGKTQPVTITLANAAVQTNKMVISPDNANIFVALGPAGTIVLPFNAGVASGSNPLGSTYTPIPVLHTSGEAYSVAVDSSTTPRLFYIGEYLGNSGGTSGGLRVFNYSSLGTSALTQVSGSPFASGGLSPNYILPDPVPLEISLVSPSPPAEPHIPSPQQPRLRRGCYPWPWLRIRPAPLFLKSVRRAALTLTPTPLTPPPPASSIPKSSPIPRPAPLR